MKQDWSYSICSIYSRYILVAHDKLLSFSLRRTVTKEAKELNMM